MCQIKLKKQDLLSNNMTIVRQLEAVREQINRAECAYQRKPHSVTLLAASKSQSVEKIKIAIDAGQRVFGENYVQEALAKMKALQAYPLEWHFIGAIQANKTRDIAENFDWVHGVSRIAIAERLHKQRPHYLSRLNVCIQVNISEEKSKAGVSLAALPAIACVVAAFDRLQLRGLMTIPEPHHGFDQQRTVYEKLAEAQQALIANGLPLDTLSMGMSEDFVAAIAAGSTIVRVGSRIFGPREF
jgi:pyridoxal phosphate enzyme (YggS family)